MNGIKIEGLENLMDVLENMADSVGDRNAHDITNPAAEMVEKAVLARVPLGPTGNLRRSVVLRKMDNPGVWVVAMDRGIAPHAHLVEYGHSGGASPHPFFRPAVDSTLPRAEGMIEREIKIRIDRAG